MNTQIIIDHNGKPAGVFIPIKDWEKLKKKYPNMDEERSTFILSDKQKEILESQVNLEENQYQDSDSFLFELKKDNGI